MPLALLWPDALLGDGVTLVIALLVASVEAAFNVGAELPLAAETAGAVALPDRDAAAGLAAVALDALLPAAALLAAAAAAGPAWVAVCAFRSFQ